MPEKKKDIGLKSDSVELLERVGFKLFLEEGKLTGMLNRVRKDLVAITTELNERAKAPKAKPAPAPRATRRRNQKEKK